MATTFTTSAESKSMADQLKEKQIIRETIGIKIDKDSLTNLEQPEVDDDDMKLYRINVEESETMKI